MSSSRFSPPGGLGKLEFDPKRDVLERMAVIEYAVMELVHSLLGNGQPGELEKIKARLAFLERWLFWAMGAAAGIGFVAGLFGKKLFP